MSGGWFRISSHIRECNNNYHHQIQHCSACNHPAKTFRLCHAKTLELCSPLTVSLRRPASLNALRVSFAHCVQPNSSHSQQSPVLSHDRRYSQSEDGLEPPSGILPPISGGIVALGKFDALHIGHRELAIQAAKMGCPYLLSFIGMAEVLGWEPRAPIVAKCDRKRVLSTWSPLCGGVSPKEYEVEFSKVRSLTPKQFVEKLSKELGARGVVAGENYRFGYRAAGDASDLVRLCEEYGLKACIISSVMDRNRDSTNIDPGNLKEQGQVSSTRVRYALSKGDMKYVSKLLGRHHRLVLAANDHGSFISSRNRISAPMSCSLNLAPKQGLYENCLLFIGDKIGVPCRVIIETMDIHLELDELDVCTLLNTQNTELLGIEFDGA